jgi:hypothetical protein
MTVSPFPSGRGAEGAGSVVAVVVLLLAITLRSTAWNAVDLAHQGAAGPIIALPLAAAIGKLAGGLLADRLGWGRWARWVAFGAAVLFLGGAGPAAPVALGLGVALLQSTTPVALAALGRALPRQPATAAGLALGLAVALGAVPIIFGWGGALSQSPWLPALALGAGLALAAALARPQAAAHRGAHSPAVEGNRWP